MMRRKLDEEHGPGHGYRVYLVLDLRYGKVREWTDIHEQIQFAAFARNDITGHEVLIGSRNPRDRAIALYQEAGEGSTPLALSRS